MEPREAGETLALVAAAKTGSSEAFGQLYDYYAPRIFKFISFKVGTKEQAEDILQDTFLKAWRGLQTLRLEELNFSAWLYSIARNTVNDHYRKVYRQPPPLELDEALSVASGDSPAALALQESELEQVRKASAELPPHYQQVLELRFIQEFTVEETAKVIGKTALAVRLIQHRALKQLRSILHRDYGPRYQEV
jgi:RNA polymerase sigma-70 factor (ECF subfamily)